MDMIKFDKPQEVMLIYNNKKDVMPDLIRHPGMVDKSGTGCLLLFMRKDG